MSRDPMLDEMAALAKAEPFVLLPENRFAHAAAMQLQHVESGQQNLVVTVYGPSGCGKTLLARHVVKAAIQNNEDLRLACFTAAEFAAELARASEAKSIAEFQKSYRKMELIICEDIQALCGRKETQQQILALLNDVGAAGGRVLLTSSEPPGELKGLSAKLVSRCHGGVCAAIEPLDRPSRVKLLTHFSTLRQTALAEDVIQKLAKEFPVSPRELDAVIVQLDMLARQRQVPIDLALVKQLASSSHAIQEISISTITKAVAKEFKVAVADLRSSGRLQSIAQPRHVAMFLTRELTDMRFNEIGEYFDGRNHSTIVHAFQRIERLIEEDPKLAQQIDHVCRALRVTSPLDKASTLSTTR